MKKTILTVVLAMLCLKLAVTQNAVLKARVTDPQGKTLSGVTVSIKGSDNKTKTDNQGSFILRNFQNGQILILSHLGFQTKALHYNQITDTIILETQQQTLQEINVVSTGYQNIPKERATGSFTQIDNKTLNRSVGTNILDRLEGVTSGMSFNKGLPGAGNNAKLSIHGRSTIFAKADPLIILNGFIYEGNINQINPADIENITLLKDAAASSIWGSRSGNGVIIITTKHGKRNQPLAIEMSTTLSLGARPDLYYPSQLGSAEYIELEQYLFSKGFYNSRFSNPRNAVSTAVELFNQRKNHKISAADSAAKIDALKSQDIRTDLSQYAYRPKTQQQYQLNLSGGSANQSYYLSAGYDKNLENRVSDSYQRLSGNGSNTFTLLKDRLNISTEMSFISSHTQNSTPNYVPFSPYDQLTDAHGNALPVVSSTAGYRMSYVDTAGAGKLLDWHYRPKEELRPNNSIRLTQYRLKAGLSFKLLQGLELSANYQYLHESHKGELDNDLSRYYTRNLINQYTNITNGTVNQVIPEGSIFRDDRRMIQSHIFRGQLSYQKSFGINHQLNAIAGYEGADNRASLLSQTFYGYDPQTLTHANASISPLVNYPLYYGLTGGKINTAASLNSSTDINQSLFTNISYAYKGRYILSASARKDESNLFGVRANQKGVPLWSAGIAWNLSQENFYHLPWLPVLKLRLTYGYNGNVDKSLSAYLTATYAGPNDTNGDPYSVIFNPPNPSLRWEKVRTWNAGLDFNSNNNRLSGSIDVYRKQATDLIGNNPIPLQSGVAQFKGNGANLLTRGIDLVLNSRNLNNSLCWNTSFLLNFNTDRVTKYLVKQTSNLQIIAGNFENPLQGYPYYAVYSFPSAGLDASGRPQGFLNGAISKDYTQIASLLDPGQLIYHGSAAPKYSGSLINTFSYKHFELSVNLVYKLDYYFRRTAVFSGSNYGFASSPVYQLSDYNQRWQKPGDEQFTRIPALIYPASNPQNTFFQYSSDLVEKGDHIRLRDLKLSYQLNSQAPKPALKKASFFLYLSNLGILWKANTKQIDPDFGSTGIPQPFSASLGIHLSL